MTYDYFENVKNDAIEAIKDYMEWNNATIDDLDENDVYGDLFLRDSVTGNASGSYTFSTWQAEENICHNMDLARDAFYEFGYDGIPADYVDNPEAIDVTIRCYVLGQVIGDAIKGIEEEMEEATA